MSPDQLELFPRAKLKLFRSASGGEVSYWRLPSGKIRVALSDGALIDVTRQSPGRTGHPRLYTKIPGQGGIVQARNLKTILVQIALLDQIRALNKSIQIKLKQQDDAARTLSDLTKRESVPKPERWTNTLALEWALDQELATGTKAVLVTFAAHCNADGETWPSVKRIAEKWKMDRDTVRVAIRDLIERSTPSGEKLLVDTGKRAGSTRQVKVYRLPAIAFESGGDGHLFKEDGSADKAREKRRESAEKAVATATPNKEYRIKEKLLVNRVGGEERLNQAPDEIDKATRLYADEQLLGRLSAIVRPSEILRNLPMWRARIKASPKAIIKAIKEYNGLSKENLKQIKNPAAWMTKQYRLFGGRSVAKPV